MNSRSGWRERFAADPPGLAGGVVLRVESHADELTLRLRQESGGVSADLRAAFLTVPYPSGLRRLLARDPTLEAVVVEHIPSGLDAAAEEAGVSYLDRHGNGRVVAPGLVYVSSPRVPSAARFAGRDVGGAASGAPRGPGRRVSPFAPKASRIVRGLLAKPQQPRRLSDLAREVEVDPGNAHRVLGALVEMGLVERDDDRYLVPDPGSLLEAWAESTRRPSERVVLQLSVDPRGWVTDLIESEPDGFAVSGELAAELLAPYLRAHEVILHCLDAEAFGRIGRAASSEAGLVLPATGRVVAVPADERVGDFGSTVAGLPVVSPAQLYVDLFRARGRAREAAEHVRREVLGF